jgi:ribosomal protein S18 acetylase RimI-like enzyme
MTGADIRVRHATADDRAFILELVPELLTFGPPAWRNREEMVGTDTRVIDAALVGRTEGASVVVAVDKEGARLGFIHVAPLWDYYLEQSCGHIWDIVVRPEARGRGVGRTLIAAAEQWARDRGYPLLTLHVFVENRAALRLYEELGFAPESMKCVKRIG